MADSLFPSKEEEKAAKRAALEAKRAAKKAAKKGGKDDGAEVAADIAGVSVADLKINEDGTGGQGELSDAKRRAMTGVLSSHRAAKDIKIDAFSMTVAGQELISDCSLELSIGRRYGIIGDNGSGKSNMLASIALREVPIPEHIDLYYLHQEADPTERTAVESVIDHVTEEIARLEALCDRIQDECGFEDERLNAIGERLDELDPSKFEATARKVLFGLGFNHTMQERMTKDMSGGWRMRVSLAKALFAAPTLLILDEPTNHLDLEACVWLEEHLKEFKKTLLVVSHSQDFLNAVCNQIIWLERKTLRYYTGNYATFCKLVDQEEKIQLKVWEKQQTDIEKLTDFVAVNKANKKTAKSAASKEKVLTKIQSESVEKPKCREPTLQFSFPDCEKLPPPVLPFDNVSFSYSGLKKDNLYTNLDMGVDCDSRVALVGPNGSGKSTLMKLMTGELQPTEGSIKRHSHLVVGRYNQHSNEVLEPDVTPLEHFKIKYDSMKMKEEYWRSFLGSFGVRGRAQTVKIGLLSDGQKSRIIFAMVCLQKPNLLLLDEPTNHLDVDAIDSLAMALKQFQGGLVLVSHDFRLIDQVADEIWVCEKQGVTVWKGTIHEYKAKLAKALGYTSV